MNLTRRILGCLGGLALGDALGAPVEFLTREHIRQEFTRVSSFVQPPAWHPHHNMQPGQITDDTGQTIAMAHALDPRGFLTAEAAAKYLLQWAEETGDLTEAVIGPSTRRALERLRDGESPRLTGKTGTTNGAAYRGIIPGMVNYRKNEMILPQVVEACLPTHGTGPAISGAAAVAFAVAEALQDSPSLAEIFSAAREGAELGRGQGAWAWSTPLEKRIELALRMVEENPDPDTALDALADYVGTDLLVPESVACVFGVISLADGDPMKAIEYGANIGGDTDTIAALAGAICGAWKGADALDQEMLTQLEEVNHLDLNVEAHRLAGIVEKRNLE